MLLPNRFQIVNDMPSLGALVKEAIQPKPADQYASFYTNTSVTLPDGSSTFISEKDCRQIKGAAQEHALGASKDLASASVAAPPSPAVVAGKFKVGGKVRVTTASTGWLGAICTIVALRDCSSLPLSVVNDSTKVDGLLKFDEVELIPPVTPDDRGWIAHRPGDVQPVPNKTIVHCKLPGGELSSLPPTKATGWNWNYVVAYRVVTP